MKKPRECSAGELAEFRKLVLAGGEVTPDGLEGRIQRAAALAFVRSDHTLLGIAALKRPLGAYRESVSTKAGVKLPAAAFPYELGWVYVTPKARGRGVSRQLVEALVAASGDAGLFATSRSDNEPMHRSLRHSGFEAIGKTYRSDYGSHTLRVFTRTGHTPE